MRSYAEALSIAETWVNPPFDDDTRTTVHALLSLPEHEREKAILDQFGYDVSFGTAGMRAVVDVGTARMNRYTIERVSFAVAKVIISKKQNMQERPSIVLGYDGRRESESFARIAVECFLSQGINVFALERIVPTPVVAFATRRLKATCGVMVTSSHNSAEYNGYKVYAANGAQIIAPFDKEVKEAMHEISFGITLHQSGTRGQKTVLDEKILRDYIEWVVSEVDFAKDRSQRIVFTALHGAAGALMNAAFYKSGFKNFLPVPQQYEPHPLFPTVKAPNPENPDSLKLALEKAHADNADLIVATDGDGDRVGVAFRNTEGDFTSLSGNQIGTVFLYYLLSKLREKGKIHPHLFALSSVVSTPLTRTICEKFGVEYYETLTGFKNMGNKAEAVVAANSQARMVLAFEEAFGVTVGDSRDKDGIISCLLAAHISGDGGFTSWLEKMYSECGYAAEDAVERTFLGSEGIHSMQRLMNEVRVNAPKEFLASRVVKLRDFQTFKEIVDGEDRAMTHLPQQNLLHITNSQGDWLAIRPSGTEPKVKVYLGVYHTSYSRDTVKAAHARLKELKNFAESLLSS